MTDALATRGPDDRGCLVLEEDRLMLGNRRLSIIDLSPAGHQPMCTPDGVLAIAYNGEIYNFRELRRELQTLGYAFGTKSDTEVILAAFRTWGPQCLARFKGMFAFALWDRRTRELFCARDRFGEKPFLYWHDATRFVFASELKSLLESRLVPRRLDRMAVNAFLLTGSIPQPRSILDGVAWLPAGHWLAWREGTLRTGSFWDVPSGKCLDAPADDREYRDRLRVHLEAAVNASLVSDVPVGIFLSGGTDSSLLVALASRLGAAPLRTFSVGFEVGGRAFNELPFAREVARRFGTEHAEVVLSERELREQIDHVGFAIDQPSYDGLNSYFVSRAARGFVRVALSGLGADEAFGGYPVFRFARMFERLLRARAGPRRFLGDALRGSETLSARSVRWGWRLRAGLAAAGFYRRPSELFLTDLAITVERERSELLQPEFHDRDARAAETSYADRLRALEDGEPDWVAALSRLYLKTYLTNTLLHHTDVMSMASSIEVRAPYLDFELIEYACSIPSRLRVSPSRGKLILAQLAKEVLPASIVDRRKMGFAFPIGYWLKTQPMREVVEDLLSTRSLADRGVFRPAAARGAWRRFLEGRQSGLRVFKTVSLIWMLAIFELWCRRFRPTV